MERTYHNKEKASSVREDDSVMRFYASQDEQELVRLKESINRSATEKFYRLMGLMKTGNMLKKAKIYHKS